MKTLIYSVLFLFPFILNAQTDTTFSELYFKKGKWTISDLEKSKLQFIDKDNAFTLAGFTDADADSIFNYELSKKRVTEIENYLIEKGVDQKYISKYYYGEKDADSKDMYSRRVEVYSYEYIDSSKLKPIISSKTADTVINQLFTINTTKDTTLLCAEGTNITIVAGTFNEKEVLVQVKEFYDMDDIISANLFTVSDGNLLESKGMLYIKATANNKELIPNKALSISMKNNSDTLAQGFKIFTGASDPHGNINWKVNSNARIDNRPYVYTLHSGLNERSKLRLYLDKNINKSIRDGYKEDFKTCKNYKYDRNKIKTLVYVDTDGNINIIDNNYVIQDSNLLNGRKYYINGRLNRLCYDYCNEILSSLSPLPEKYRPSFNVYAKYIYQTRIIKFNDYKKIRIPRSNNNINFPTLTLGWINCDRFINVPSTVNVMVNAEKDMKVILIAKEMKSMMNPYVSNGLFNFDNIPKNMDMTIFSYKLNNDNTYSFSAMDVSASTDLVRLPQPEILTEQEFKERLKMFN